MDLEWSSRVVSYSLFGDILNMEPMIYAGVHGQEASLPPNMFYCLNQNPLGCGVMFVWRSL